MTPSGAGCALPAIRRIGENAMGTPQTPDSMKKSQQEKAPPPKREDARPGKLSNPDEGDKAEKRQGGS
jgi:hypothetical protein